MADLKHCYPLFFALYLPPGHERNYLARVITTRVGIINKYKDNVLFTRYLTYVVINRPEQLFVFPRMRVQRKISGSRWVIGYSTHTSLKGLFCLNNVFKACLMSFSENPFGQMKQYDSFVN